MSVIEEVVRLAVEDPSKISPDLISQAMNQIMDSKATEEQITSYLLALNSISISADILCASAKVMVEKANPCEISSDIVLDIVGTGGDKFDTFNVSTASAFVLAACGYKIAKHGNRSSSGRCGSADFVQELGAEIYLTGEQVATAIEHCNYGFLFAQSFHPNMKTVGPVRKALKVRTIFNMLGPLTNPTKPTHMLLGVGDIKLGPQYAEIMSKTTHIKKALIVHSMDGLDEIGPNGQTQVWLVDNTVSPSTTKEFKIQPSDFGLSEHPIEAVLGADPPQNVATWQDILNGKEGPVTDFLVMNSAAALFLVADVGFKKAVEIIRKAITDGSVKQVVQKYIEISQSFNKK